MKHGNPISPRNQTNNLWNGHTHLSRQGQSQTNAVKANDYDNSILSPAQCFPGVLYPIRNNDQLRCLSRNSTEASKKLQNKRLDFETYTIPPRPCSERFPPFPVPQAQCSRDAFQLQRRSERGRELLAFRPGGRLLKRGFSKLSSKV
ncbi:hypothetical protein TNCV_256241 [Trichonephila clavipes]|nr:hypothetical protein TNCV_256241 [Trichonephila clavipes]